MKIAGTKSIDEGSSYTLYLLADDPGSDTISSWTVNWGDNSEDIVAGSSKTVSHRYADDGDYAIRVTAVDEDCAAGASYSAGSVAWLDRQVYYFRAGSGNTRNFYTLTTQPGTWNAVDAAASQLGGYPATITTGYEQEFLDENFFRLAVPPERVWINGFTRNDKGDLLWNTGETSKYENWEEGTPQSGLVAMAGQSAPAEEGPLSRWVVASASEVLYGIVEFGSIDKLVSWSPGSELAVTVENRPPRVALDGPGQVDEGSSFTLSLGVPSDPGDDKVIRYLIHWGDGGEVQTVEAPDSNGFQYAQTISHIYGDNGDYTITLQLVDEADGTSDNDTDLTAHILNVGPVTILAPPTWTRNCICLTLGLGVRPGDDAVVNTFTGTTQAIPIRPWARHARLLRAEAKRNDAVELKDETDPPRRRPGCFRSDPCAKNC